jgi:hypothetical protein
MISRRRMRSFVKAHSTCHAYSEIGRMAIYSYSRQESRHESSRAFSILPGDVPIAVMCFLSPPPRTS